MKMNILRITFMVALIMFASYGIYHSKSAINDLSDVALANVEALASFSEWTPQGWTCFWRYVDNTSSDLFFPITRCDDCYTVTATTAWVSGNCWHK